MTLYSSNSATTGLGYGLGGSSAAAQPTSTASVNIASTYSMVAQAQQALLQAQQQAQQAQQAYMGQVQALQAGQAGNLYCQGTTLPLSSGGTIPVTFVSTGDTTNPIPTTGFCTFEAAFSQARPVTPPSTDAYYRSMELLYEWLTPEQRKQLAIRTYFDVVGGDTGRRYRLYPPGPYNIHQLCQDSDEMAEKICFVPKDPYLPTGDIWLCQKLALELDEKATLAIANRQTYHGY